VVADLAAMRDAVARLGGDPGRVNPVVPVDLIIDHSVQVDEFRGPGALEKNVGIEMRRNAERYAFLRWAAGAFARFRVVPPGAGICHQVNLESFAQVVRQETLDGVEWVFPDTLVGTDSHTTMINGLAVLGWGVGGIEAEAAMLGHPLSMLIPDVVGVRLSGALPGGVYATDLVLEVTRRLRAHGVVGKFVEFFGPGLDSLTLPDRATVANMAPEYGATCAFFPVDGATLDYLRFTGRDTEVERVRAYCQAQGLWRDPGCEPVFTAVLNLDLAEIEPCIAGPKRPHERVALSEAAAGLRRSLDERNAGHTPLAAAPGTDASLADGDVVIAAITSCTNTSNPAVMMAAGLVARAARARGLRARPWVKTSLAPGSQVVTRYLEAAGLLADLQAIGFELVGYGCTTCIGNSGPLDSAVEESIRQGGLQVAAVLSGNRNFEGRVHPLTTLNYLMSPPLVVAYALAGSMRIDLHREPLGRGSDGRDVYLRDLLPTSADVQRLVADGVTPEMFRDVYAGILAGTDEWDRLPAGDGVLFDWNPQSTYILRPPFVDAAEGRPVKQSDIRGARILALLGDMVTTDHISPAGSIAKKSPAAAYLQRHGIAPADFNSYGARRGNHEVMARGTYANTRLRNEMTPTIEGGVTRHVPSDRTLPIFEAAEAYAAEGTPLVVVAGREYGAGSSRDWAAKGVALLGVRAVLAESFERIHRSNLVGMGVLPLEFPAGVTRKTLKLDGSETLDIVGLEADATVRMPLACTITRKDGTRQTVTLTARIDTCEEIDYIRYGGILPRVLAQMV
jgi:aconitate hydratase